jgi:hypothetical protein
LFTLGYTFEGKCWERAGKGAWAEGFQEKRFAKKALMPIFAVLK